MEHEVLADLPAAVGEPVRMLLRRRIQQQARRADAVAGQHDDMRLDLHLITIGIVVDRPRRHAVLTDRDLAHPAMGPQFHASPQRVRPVGDVGAALRPLRAAADAGAQIDALGAAIVILRDDRGVGRPPGPPQLVQPLGQDLPRLAKRQRRQTQGIVARIGRVALQARDTGHTVVLTIKGRQGVVIDWPVIGHPVQALDPEVGRMKAREMPREQHCPAANTVEIGDLDRRVVLVDGIVRCHATQVRVDHHVPLRAGLPVAAGTGILQRVHRAALLQADDMHFRLRQAPRHCRAGRAGADDQDVNGIVGHGDSPVGS